MKRLEENLPSDVASRWDCSFNPSVRAAGTHAGSEKTSREGLLAVPRFVMGFETSASSLRASGASTHEAAAHIGNCPRTYAPFDDNKLICYIILW
jgi:hypothetical protein